MQEEEIPIKRPSTFPLFSKYFALTPLNVIDFSHTNRKQFDDFIDAFKKRIQIEANYSKSLQIVSKTLDKYIQPGTQKSISYICSAFRVENQQRAHQAKELAESLRTQIYDICSELAARQAASLKKVEKDLKKYYKEHEKLEDNFLNALENYTTVNSDTEEMIIKKNIMKFTTNIPQQKKLKLITKSMENIKEKKEYEKIYLQAVKEYNEFAKLYNSQIVQEVDLIESGIREQIILQSDCIRKLIVCQISMFKNIQYDLINISKQMENLDTQKDVEIFVDQNKGNMKNCIINLNVEEKDKEEEVANGKMKRKSSFSSSSSLEGFNNKLTLKKIEGKSLLSDSLFLVEEDYFTSMLNNKKNKQLRSIIDGLYKKYKKQNLQNGTNSTTKSEIKEAPEEKIEDESNGNGMKEQESNGTILQEKDLPASILEYLKSAKISEVPFNNSSYSSKQIQITALIENQTHEQILESILFLTKLISEIWDSPPLGNESLKEKLGKISKYLSCHFYRLIAYIFIEEYRIHHEVLIATENIKNCGKVLKLILEESYKRGDAFIIRGILGLIFTFYWSEDKNKKLIYQNPDVYSVDIWRKNDFWEAVIFETTYEQMAAFNIQKGETQAETILREKNLIFSQLASYCHYMIMLGINSKNVRNIVGRYCRLHEMSEEQNRDLSKMINNTLKQYKEIANTLKSKKESKSTISEV